MEKALSGETPVKDLRTFFAGMESQGRKGEIPSLCVRFADAHAEDPELLTRLNRAVFELATGTSVEEYADRLERTAEAPSPAARRSEAEGPTIRTVTLSPSLDLSVDVEEVSFSDGPVSPKAAQVDAGGKGINVSRALKAWGGKSRISGVVGGATGRALSLLAEGLGLLTEGLSMGPGDTRINLRIHSGHHGEKTLKTIGGKVSPDFWRTFLKSFESQVKKGDMLMLSGGLSPGMPEDAYAQIIERTRSKGVFTLLDTEGAPLRDGVAERPDFVGINHEEMAGYMGVSPESLFEDRAAVLATAAVLVKKGIPTVVVTLASKGMVMATKEGCWYASAPRIELKSDAGAGDVVKAAFLYGRKMGWGPEETMRFATAAGSATAALPGTAVPGLENVEPLLKQVVVDHGKYPHLL